MDFRTYSVLFSLCALCMTIAVGCVDSIGSVEPREDPMGGLVGEVTFDTKPSPRAAQMAIDDKSLLVSLSKPDQIRPAIIRLQRDESLGAAIDRAGGRVLLDFFADWCGPCKVQGQILHDVEQRAADSGTQMIKINVDEHPELAQQLNVSSLPTLMMIKDGRVVERRSGVTQEPTLITWMR